MATALPRCCDAQLRYTRNAGICFVQEKYVELGAAAPSGVLLCGPPGVGKTLIAKAIAGESEVPFFSTAGSEFSNQYAGIGASRIRDMFETARASAPCILFIDEFDGVGQQREAGGGVGQEQSVQTINQLLTEMDGFEDNEGALRLRLHVHTCHFVGFRLASRLHAGVGRCFTMQQC